MKESAGLFLRWSRPGKWRIRWSSILLITACLLASMGFWGHGEDTWPSNTHREANNIPLIIKAPGAVEAGRVDDRLVGTTDIFTTVMDYVGVEIPGASRRPDRSLRPIIENRSTDWSNAVFMEQEETRAIRTQEWLFMKRLWANVIQLHK